MQTHLPASGLGQSGGSREATIDHSSAPLRACFRSTSASTGQGYECHQFAFACAFPLRYFCIMLVSSRIVSVVQAARADPSHLFHDHAARIHTHTLSLTPSIFSPSSLLRFPLGIANPPRTSDLPRTRTNTTWTHQQCYTTTPCGSVTGSTTFEFVSHIPPLTYFARRIQNSCLSYGLGLEYKYISARCNGVSACAKMMRPGGASGCTRGSTSEFAMRMKKIIGGADARNMVDCQ
jgi:hypothetical protein